MTARGELDKRLIVAGILAGVGLAMLIAGSVMLGIGVHKSKSTSSCPTCRRCPSPPSCPLPAAPTVVFTSSYDTSITWSMDLENSSSNYFKTTAQQLSNNITTALVYAPPGTQVIINRFQPSEHGVGVDFYSMIVFPYQGMSATQVQTQMNTMYLTATYVNPTTQCALIIPPPGENSTITPATIPPVTTAKVLQPGAYCDASEQNLLQVFLIDCAPPQTGTLDDKLATIRQFLNSYDIFLNLPNTNGSFGQVGFQYITYAGTPDQNLTGPSPVCYDVDCWHTVVDGLIPALVNPFPIDDSHFLSQGLNTALASLRPRLLQPINLLIISDGFDITDQYSNSLANQLKTNLNCRIDAFVVTSNNFIKNAFDNVVTGVDYRFYVNSWNYLNYANVDYTIAGWSCTTTYPTSPPITAPPTPPTIKTTTTPKPTHPPTTPSGPLPVPPCTVDVLFLVDESTSMILSQKYQSSISYALSLAQRISQQNNSSSFAIITFNSNIVYNSTIYTNYAIFKQQVDSIPTNSGATDFAIGFQAARDLIAKKARYNKNDVRSVLIFISDGFDNDPTTINTVQGISRDMRQNYATEIIGIGLSEDLSATQLTKKAIDYEATDNYVQSQFINTTNPNADVTINATLTDIICKADASHCYSDIIFVIEVSEAETDPYIAIQKQTVNLILDKYTNLIGPNAGEVSLVFFSSPDGFQRGMEIGRSGILYKMWDNAALAVNKLASTKFQVGGASDIDLAMSYTLQILNENTDNNDQLVLFFARGTYRDADNCCDNPSNSSALVRSKSTVQGIVIGPYSNKTLLDQFTGSNSVDGNKLVVINATKQVDVASSAQAIYSALVPIINSHMANAYCLPIPVLTQCSEFDDIAIILHANTVDNWNLLKSFVIQEVIPALMGPISDDPMNPSLYVNLAVTYYFGQNVQVINNFWDRISTKQLVAMINSTAFQPSTQTNSLSGAYKKVNDQITRMSRQLTSKTILVITDTIDTADEPSAILERSALPYSYVYGMKLNAKISDVPIPGQDDGYLVLDIQQINTNNTRSSISVANIATAGVCRFVPITTTPGPTTTTQRPTPGPVPRVKVRDIWPDITILIDASAQNQSYFEMQRQFLRKTFLNQFKIGQYWSRFAVATYNTDATLICQFSDIYSYWDLEACLGSQLNFSAVNPYITTRDINQTLSTLSNGLFNEIFINQTGYRSLNVNYLYVLTNGASSNNFYSPATALKSQGVRVIGIDISVGSQMTLTALSDFGPDSYSVSKFFIDSIVSDQLSQSIIQQTTTIPRPILSSFFSDFYFIVDTSSFQSADIPNVQSFVLKFVDQLTVSPHRSRVSIVPFSNDVMNPLTLSSNSTGVMDYISNWQTAAPGTNSSNIGAAITFVQAQVTGNPSKISHIIYLVGATNTTGSDLGGGLLKTGANAYVLSYNSVNYTGQLGGDPSRIFKVSNSAALLNWVESSVPVDVRGRNPVNVFFNTLLDVQENADTASFPMEEIAADIVIFLDETGLSNDDFASIKQFLVNFTSQFTISPLDTQFALQSFTSEIIPDSGWHFSDGWSNDQVINLINNLTWTQSTVNANADLAGAVNQGLTYFLQPVNGWRQDITTYSIIITNAATFIQSAADSMIISQLQNKSSVYAISVNNVKSAYVNQYINTGFYEIEKTPKSLTTYVGAGKNLSDALNTDYKSRVYPPLPSLDSIQADFVFLIDNTNVTDDNVQMIKNFIKTFTNDVGDPSYSTISVINYNSIGVVQPQSWTLKTFPRGNRTIVESAIQNMTITSDSSAPDLTAAIGFLSAVPKLFGNDGNTPIFVISLFNSPTIQSSLSTSVMKTVNLNYFTFALQYGNNMVSFDYVPSFLGSDYSEDFVYTKDLSTYEVNSPTNAFVPLNTYIQTEYRAWQQSF